MTLILDLLYGLLLLIVGPVYLLVRRLKGKPTAPIAERLWRFPKRQTDRPTIWIHGVSVGEILAARGLVKSLSEEWPEYEVVISTTTPTGMEVARREYPEHVAFYCPLDLSFSIKSVLRRMQPKLVILMELELWPNMLRVLGQSEIPIVLANGKISERSAQGYRRLMRLYPTLLNPIDQFCMQHDGHGARLRSLGVNDARIEVLGNLKVDNLSEPLSTAEIRRKDLGLNESPVFVAGSTHTGEDEVVFRAYLAMRKDLQRLQLVLAPRHLERISAIEELASSLGLKTVRRSDPELADKMEKVVLLDTLGELRNLFSLADLVFLGGSLAKVGGHNVLEPAAAGAVQLLGPHTKTVQGFVDELVDVGAAFVVRDAEQMANRGVGLLQDDQERLAKGQAARDMVARHRGALRRTMKVLSRYRSSVGLKNKTRSLE